MLTRRWLRTLAALVLAGLALASAGSAQALGDTVTPDLGPPGTAYSFTAVGFGANEIVRVTFQAPDGSRTRFADNRGQDVSLVADVGGTVRWVYTTPSNAADGIYVAEAANISGQIRRRIGFIVQAGATPTDLLPPQPSDNVSVNPPLGPPGTLFAFRASGFLPGEGIGIWIHRPDGQIITVTADGSDVKANQIGIASWSVTANASLADGVYTMVAEGVTSTQVRVVRFQVQR